METIKASIFILCVGSVRVSARAMTTTSRNNRWIVITVPHAVCPDRVARRSAHLCDLLAPQAAACMHAASKTLAGGRTVSVLAPFLPGDTSRDECDLNRRWCDMRWRERDTRQHPYRRRVRTFVQENSARVAFVLDVHSYPRHVSDWGDYELVVLDDDEDGSRSVAPYVSDFVSFMGEAGVPTAARLGQNNDIHYEMRTVLRKRSMLLEFNESLASDGARLAQTCRLIVLWFERL